MICVKKLYCQGQLIQFEHSCKLHNFMNTQIRQTNTDQGKLRLRFLTLQVHQSHLQSHFQTYFIFTFFEMFKSGIFVKQQVYQTYSSNAIQALQNSLQLVNALLKRRNQIVLTPDEEIISLSSITKLSTLTLIQSSLNLSI